MKREVVARLEDPFCNQCITDRIKAAGGKEHVEPIELHVDKHGYAIVEKAA